MRAVTHGEVYRRCNTPSLVGKSTLYQYLVAALMPRLCNRQQK